MNLIHRLVSAKLSPRAADRWMFAMIATFAIVMSVLGVFKYLTFNSGYDLAQYDQLIWNSLHGRLFQNTFVPDAPFFLGKTFTPILLAFVPLYALWSNPIVLIVVQIIGIAVGAFPLYWFARAKIGYASALALTLAYLLFPPLDGIYFGDFHEIALAVPILAFAVFFLLRQHYAGLMACLILAMMTKEELWLLVVAFGFYVWFVQRRTWLGLSISLISAIGFIVLLQFLIPYFHGQGLGGTFYYFGAGELGDGQSRYAYLGRNLAEIVRTLVTQPNVVLEHLLVPGKIVFVLNFLVPLLFLPLIGWQVFLLSAPAFGYTLLSEYPYQYAIHEGYTPPLIVFPFFAAGLGISRLALKIPRVGLIALLFAASVLNYGFQSAGLFALQLQRALQITSSHTILGQNLVRAIPGKAIVVAQPNLTPHLSQREGIYQLPFLDYRRAEFVLMDQSNIWYSAHRAGWEFFRATGFFETIADEDGWWLAKRRSPDRTVNFRFDNRIALLGYAIPPVPLSGGMSLRPMFWWRAERAIDKKYKTLVQVVDARGHVWASENREPTDGDAKTQWQVNKTFIDQNNLALPPTMPAGEYEITLSVYAEEEEPLSIDQSDTTEIVLTKLRIEKNRGSFAASQLQIRNPLSLDMQELRLIGYVPPRQTIKPGELLQVGLYWRARAKPQADYAVVIQLRTADGRIAFEHTQQPANGVHPTLTWHEGEVLLDWHDFFLPADLRPNDYQIVAGLRDAATQRWVAETNIATITVLR